MIEPLVGETFGNIKWQKQYIILFLQLLIKFSSATWNHVQNFNNPKVCYMIIIRGIVTRYLRISRIFKDILARFILHQIFFVAISTYILASKSKNWITITPKTRLKVSVLNVFFRNRSKNFQSWIVIFLFKVISMYKLNTFCKIFFFKS